MILSKDSDIDIKICRSDMDGLDIFSLKKKKKLSYFRQKHITIVEQFTVMKITPVALINASYIY